MFSTHSRIDTIICKNIMNCCLKIPLTLSQTSSGFYISTLHVLTSNFSFSHSVFPFRELPGIFIKFKIVVCKLFQFGTEILPFGKGLPYNPVFKELEKKVFLKTLREKEKMHVTSFFSFSHIVYYLSQIQIPIIQSHSFHHL